MADNSDKVTCNQCGLSFKRHGIAAHQRSRQCTGYWLSQEQLTEQQEAMANFQTIIATRYQEGMLLKLCYIIIMWLLTLWYEGQVAVAAALNNPQLGIPELMATVAGNLDANQFPAPDEFGNDNISKCPGILIAHSLNWKNWCLIN